MEAVDRPKGDAMPRAALVAVLFACRLLVSTPGAAGQEAGVSPSRESPVVFRDGYGVPHVFGPSDEGVVFGAAWVQAEEDWPMVEENFLRAMGRAAEAFGEEALLTDYLTLALEIPRLAEEEYARSSPRMRSLLDAYADGFNAWLAAHPEAPRRGPEKVPPWATLALLRYKYHELEFLGYAGLEEEWVARLLERGWPIGGSDREAVTPAVSRIPQGTGRTGLRFAGALEGPLGELPLGSNQWAIGPSRTVDGHALLLVNPHQRFFGVERYLEIHLHSDAGLVFSGLTRFGFLLPYMGNNEHLGWTFTDNYADIGDLYLERFDDPANPLRYRYGASSRTAETWTGRVRVAGPSGVDERTLRFWKTHHGPIVGLDDDGRPIAARLAKLAEGGWFAQLDAMIRSRTLEEFKTAFAALDVPYMNLMYADQAGDIWYVYSSAIPRRDPAIDWKRPVDGADPATEWDGYHALEDLPQILNPPSGYLVNTNSSPLSATRDVPFQRSDFPPYMIGNEEDNARARSSRRALEEKERLSFDEFAALVWDTRLALADSLIPELADERDRLLAAPDDDLPAPLRAGSPGRSDLEEVVERLDQWDRRADVQSTATTLFVLGAERWFLDRMSSSGSPGPWAWSLALAETAARLRETWGSLGVPWGEINRLQRPPSNDPSAFSDSLPSLPVAGAPGFFGSVFTFQTEPMGSVGRRYGVHGNTFVKVIEFGPRVRGRSVLVFGQSGDPASAHYFDQAPLYANGSFKPAWMSRAEVEAHAERRYELPR
jgi:acyl-homoserine lactone acylase PvdQ